MYRRRRLFTLAFSALALSCGGDSTSPAPPGPPDNSKTPATVAVFAGSGQVAEPGAALPITPVVEVRNSAGAGIAGVAVVFAVQSGGGTIQTPNATTDAAGRASPGEWRMGPQPGTNTLRATVGSLPAVTITATAQTVVVTIPDITVGGGGGSATVNLPGSPINGMTIQVPPGAYAGNQTFSITITPSDGLTLPAGVTIAGPRIGVGTSNGALAESRMTITVPMTVPPAHFAALLALNENGTVAAVLPTLSQTSTSVTAATAHFNPAIIAAGTPVAAANAAQAHRGSSSAVTAGNGEVVVLVPTVISIDDLNQPRSSGFQPGVDSWEFTGEISTAVSQKTSDGIVGTQNWYFGSGQKTTHGALWKKWQEADPVPESNRRGLRWVSLASESIFRAASRRAVAVSTSEDPSLTALRTIQATFKLQQTPAPQSALLYSSGELGSVAVTVHGSGANALHVVNPIDPSKTYTITFSSEGMNPVTDLFPTSEDALDFLAAVPPLLFAEQSQISSQFTKVLDGTIGDAEFPKFDMRLAWANDLAKTTALGDDNFFGFAPASEYKVVMWADCSTCAGTSRSPAVPGPGPNAAPLSVFFRTGPGGTFQFAEGTMAIAGVLEAPGISTTGVALHEVVQSPEGPELVWLDWRRYTLRRLAATISPSNSTQLTGTDIQFDFAAAGLPGNLEYEWKYNASPPFAPVVTTQPSWTHNWNTEGKYTVKVTARDKTTKQPIAEAETEVTLRELPQAWRITAITKTGESGVVDPDRNWSFQQLLTHFGNSEQAVFQFQTYRTHADSLFLRPGVGVVYVHKLMANGSEFRYLGLQLTRNAIPVDLTKLPDQASGTVGLGQPCPANPTPPGFCEVTITGDNESGTITGRWGGRNVLMAVKQSDGVTLTGTFRLQAGSTAPTWHWAEYQFTATRVPLSEIPPPPP